MLKQSRWRRAALAVCLIFLLFFTLKNASYAANGIKKGLVLFGNMLLPSLLPFLVLSELFLASGTGEMLGRILARPLKLLFGLTEKGAAAFLLGAVCGVPVGILFAARLQERGEISEAELARLMLLSNTPSMGFLVSAVGVAAFGSAKIGVLLLLATLFSTLLTGVFLKQKKGDLTAPYSRFFSSETKKVIYNFFQKSARNSVLLLPCKVKFSAFPAAF